MTNAKADNHDANQASREARDNPENIDPWLKYSQDIAVGIHEGESPHCGVPKLEDSHCHVEAEEIKGPLVAVANAGLRPHAVMVEFVDALSTCAAMGNAWTFPVVTLLAPPLVVKIVGSDALLLKFAHMAVDPHCLEVAPQTHKHIEIREVSH